jgi:cation diffusion facilitator CzcD-associated flavoprotein CzcO
MVRDRRSGDRPRAWLGRAGAPHAPIRQNRHPADSLDGRSISIHQLESENHMAPEAHAALPNQVRPTERDRDVIAAQIAEVDPSYLVASLVHLTGDLSLLDTYRSAFTPLPLRTGRAAFEVEASAAAEIRARLADELARTDEPTLLMPDDAEFKAIAEFVVGESIPDDYVALLAEQAGFVRSVRTLPIEAEPSEDFDVIVIGSGLVGIAAAVKLGEAGFNYSVIEARDDIGGTWSRNRYPGVAVDTPSHYYSLSFDLNPGWSHYYPYGDQYLRYLRGVCERHGVTERVQLNTEVQSLTWHEDSAQWEVVTVRDGVESTQRARAVVTALGFFSRAIKPTFDKQEDFEGVIMHSSEWRDDVDLTGKKVVVLGAGCTASQIVANVAEPAEHLTVISRQPHWVVPGQAGAEVEEGMKWALANIPFFHQWFRLRTFWYTSDNGFPVTRVDNEWVQEHELSTSAANQAVLDVCLDYIESKFGDRPELKEKLTPDFPPFGKRIVLDAGFYDALLRDDVDLLGGTIDHYTPNGLVTTEGNEVEADVVVLATGFTLDWLCTLDIHGRDGAVLLDQWDPVPRAYLGVTAPNFPNLFITSGPNSAILHGAGNNFAGETQVHYIVECLQMMLNKGARTMEVDAAATETYNEWVDEEMATTVWQNATGAHGYYRTNGKTIVGSPWKMVDYWNECRSPREEHFHFDGVRSPVGAAG